MRALVLIALGLVLGLTLGTESAEALSRNAGSRARPGAAKPQERKPRFNKNARAAAASLTPAQLGRAYGIIRGLHGTGSRLAAQAAVIEARQRELSRLRLAAAKPAAETPAVASKPEPATPDTAASVPQTPPVEPAAADAAAARLLADQAAADEQARAEAAEKDRLARLESERLEKEQLEAQRLETERLEKERLEAERLKTEQQRLESAAREAAKPPKPGTKKPGGWEPKSKPATDLESAEPPSAEQTEETEDTPPAAAANDNSLDGLARASREHENDPPVSDKSATENQAALDKTTAPPVDEPAKAAQSPAESEPLKVSSFGMEEKAAPADQPHASDADDVIGGSKTDKHDSSSRPKRGNKATERSEQSGGSRDQAPERAMPATPAEPSAAVTDEHSLQPDDLPGSEIEGEHVHPPEPASKPSGNGLAPRRPDVSLAAPGGLKPPADLKANAQIDPPAAHLTGANSGVQMNAMLTPLPKLTQLAISPMLSGPGGHPLRAPTDLVYPSGTPRMPPGGVPRDLVSIEHGNTKKKLVALTFDDGPHPEFTSQLLAVLDHYKVRASFEMVGVQMVRYPQWVKMTHLAGHEIANHTYDHFRLPKLPYEEKVYQIDENQRLVERLTGVTPRFLRPPGGQLDAETQRICQQRGMVVAMWDVGLNDLKPGRSGKDLASTAIKEVKPGSILLGHDGSQAMIDALPAIIEGLQAKGYEFVTLSELASQL